MRTTLRTANDTNLHWKTRRFLSVENSDWKSTWIVWIIWEGGSKNWQSMHVECSCWSEKSINPDINNPTVMSGPKIDYIVHSPYVRPDNVNIQALSHTPVPQAQRFTPTCDRENTIRSADGDTHFEAISITHRCARHYTRTQSPARIYVAVSRPALSGRALNDA